MVELISESKQKARKTYNCDACLFINGGYDQDLKDLIGIGLSFSEWRTLIKARNNNWQIKPGDIYLKQFVKYDDKVSTFRAIPEVHAILIKYELYLDIF